MPEKLYSAAYARAVRPPRIMESETHTYCRPCSQTILSKWKGWPHRDVVPLLPLVTVRQSNASATNNDYDDCPVCGGTNDTVFNSMIKWLNVHGPYNTGLPDYWLLVISDNKSKWGLPYYAETMCPRCKQRAVVSEMRYPNDDHEIAYNCANCGVQSVRRK